MVRSNPSKNIHLLKHWQSKLDITTKSYFFSTIYRAPYSIKQLVTMLTLLEEFPDHISSLFRNSKNIIILGDFNIPWNKLENPDTTSMQEILDMHELHQPILYIHTHKLGNVLDWLISNTPNTIQDITYKDYLSDHSIKNGNSKLTKKLAKRYKNQEET